MLSGHPTRPLALALALLLASCASLQPTAQVTEPLHLVVLHSNDIHGQAQPLAGRWVDAEDPPPRGGLSRLAGELRAAEAAARAGGAEVLVVDGGDWFQGTPEGLVEDGRAFVELLGQVGYDAMVVGNHEFDHGVPFLAELLGDDIVPHVLANVREPATGERVAWCVPYRIEELDGPRGKLRVALVGLLTTGTPAITHEDARGLDFIDPSVELAAVRAELEALVEPVDLILPVTHLGVSADRELARAHPDIPLIVGGHSHTTLAHGVREGDTLIVQAGCKAMVMGRVDLYLDPLTLAVLSSEARLVELPPDGDLDDATLAAACAALTAIGAEQMDHVVGHFDAPLVRSRGVVSGSAGNWIADAFRQQLGTDVAIQNRGGIRRDIEAGEVRRRDLFEMQPFGNTLVAIELSGAELFATVERALTDRNHSGIEFSGMAAIYRGEAPDYELVALTVGGAPLDPSATYSLATNSFLAGGGDTYLPAEVVARESVDTGLILRDVAEEALARGAGSQVDSTNRYILAD